MRILKIKANGLELFSENLEIDFTTMQRVRNENNEILYKIAPNIYQSNVLAFVGINASGKTSTLKVISFIINMINNEPINSIKSNDILDGVLDDKEIVFDVYFSMFSESIYRLETTITKNKFSNDINDVDKKFVIKSEKLWEKKIKHIKTKKSMFDFNDLDPIQIRLGNEEYLPDDVSIMISLNKRNNSRINLKDLINWTNMNLLRILGDFPQELITFLDPSIEYLNANIEEKNDVEIRLKFKGKEEILMKSPLDLQKYLSSGTIKGINVFINAMIVLKEGGYLIIDELENHFNKEIAATLVRFFMSYRVNSKGAVLILSTHYPELLDEFERNDNIYIIKNDTGITVDNLSKLLKRNDIKKSEIYQSGYINGTVPNYKAFMELKKAILTVKR